MKNTILNITSNGVQEFEAIVGSIKKIFILNERISHNVILTFKTNEDETIYSLNPNNEVVNIYPYNFIDVQGRGCEYYSNGSLFLEVEGLQENEEIKQVSIFYE